MRNACMTGCLFGDNPALPEFFAVGTLAGYGVWM